VDLIVADPQGRQLVVDTKAVWDFYTDSETRLLPQLAKYAGMLRFLGHRIEGGAYNMIRTRRINGGKMLKAEIVQAVGDNVPAWKLAQNEQIFGKPFDKWTVDMLTETAESEGIAVVTPAEPEKLYRLTPVPLSDARVKRALEEQFGVAERILERKHLTTEQYDQLAVRSVSKVTCRSCPFRVICEAELNGEDTRLAMDTFTFRDPRELPDLDGEEDDEE
jgi:hypothetical protein